MITKPLSLLLRVTCSWPAPVHEVLSAPLPGGLAGSSQAGSDVEIQPLPTISASGEHRPPLQREGNNRARTCAAARGSNPAFLQGLVYPLRAGGGDAVVKGCRGAGTGGPGRARLPLSWV